MIKPINKREKQHNPLIIKGYLKITITDFYHPATSVRQISKCASRTITGRIFAASRFTYGGGYQRSSRRGGGVSAQRHGGQNMQLEYRVSLVGDFKKPRHRKGLQGYREKLVYR